MTITYIPNPHLPAGLTDDVVDWDGMIFDRHVIIDPHTKMGTVVESKTWNRVQTPEEIKQLSQGE